MVYFIFRNLKNANVRYVFYILIKSYFIDKFKRIGQQAKLM